MPAALRKTAISFGMVHIPISLYPAVQEKGISFHQLTNDGVRIRQKKVREDNGAEVESADIIKGYEYAKGRYVTLTEEELERTRTARDRSIRILQFTPLEYIPPVYFDKSYLSAPDGSDRAYELLRLAMQDEGVIGIGQCVLWNRQNMLALIPEPDGIRVQTLFYQAQIRMFPRSSGKIEVSEDELHMGRLLVHSMIAPYAPEKYRDEYEERLIAAIQRKIDGQEIVAAAEPQGGIADLMEALRKSLAQVKVPEPTGAH